MNSVNRSAYGMAGDLVGVMPAKRPTGGLLVCGTFPDLLSSTGTDVPGGREGSGSTQPRPAHTDGSRAPLDVPLGDAGPRALSRGFTVHAEAAMRLCRLRAMHQPELLADNHASSSGWFGAGSATGPDMRTARGDAGEGESRATSTGKVETWVACRAR